MRLDQEDEGPATRAERIADGIATRRASAGDDHLESLGLEPFGVVQYVCSHTGGVSRGVVSADVIDALAVVRELRPALDRLELSLMRIGRERNLTWGVIADALGMGSRQAAEQRMQRLLELGARHTPAEGSVGSTRGRIAESRWLARNRVAVLALARVLASLRYQSADAEDDAAELAELLEDTEPPTRSLLAWMSQILIELEAAGEAPPQERAEAFEEAARVVNEWRRVRPALP